LCSRVEVVIGRGREKRMKNLHLAAPFKLKEVKGRERRLTRGFSMHFFQNLSALERKKLNLLCPLPFPSLFFSFHSNSEADS
jgi:hypothetical protein